MSDPAQVSGSGHLCEIRLGTCCILPAAVAWPAWRYLV